MNVVFAPDWRSGVPYQRLLAEALATEGVSVSFLSQYKRVLPLTRLLAGHPAGLLHLHWPEAYYPQKGDAWDFFRRARFASDLAVATRRLPLVITAHNLAEHNLQHAFVRANYRAAYRRARLVFAHSTAAREQLVTTYQLAPENIRVVPHGDLSVVMPPPLAQAEARARLGLPAGPVCLMFGTVEPYKGQEEVIAYWREARPTARLLIAGKPRSKEYGDEIRRAADGLKNVVLHLEWLTDPDLALFLSAADLALFNYRTIFTSGAAALARSWGLPILLPERLSTVDLAEPDARVFRFDHFRGNFADRLRRALEVPANYTAAAEWRSRTSWPNVARLTAEGYREVLAPHDRRDRDMSGELEEKGRSKLASGDFRVQS